MTSQRETENSIILTRGAREIYLLGDKAKAAKVIERNSFDKIFKAAKRHPITKNIAYISL